MVRWRDIKRPTIPEWITDELIEDTLRTWQPFYHRVLEREDAIEILLVVGELWAWLEADDDEAVPGVGPSI